MAWRPPVANKLWSTGGRCAAVYSRPFRWHQKTILERFCIVSSGRHVGLSAWTALVDSPVAKTDVQKLPTTLELRENGWRVATALTTAQYVGIAWVVSTWCVINLITGDTFWKPSTGLKPVNRLTGYRINKPTLLLSVLFAYLFTYLPW